MLVSIVIPLFNEENNLLQMHKELSAEVSSLEESIEFVFVDDGSTDQSLNVLNSLRLKDNRIKIISFARNFGHQAALTAGIKASKGDAVIMMDADLQHPPPKIPEMIRLWKQGYQVVFTKRIDSNKISLLKKASSKVYYWLLNKLTSMEIPYGVADFRLWDRAVVNVFNSLKEKQKFLRGLSFWFGFNQVELTYQASDRFAGKSHYNIRRMLILGLDGITSFSTKPLYFSFVVGLSIVLVGLVFAAYILYVRFLTNASVPGWASTNILMILMFGVQILSTGIMGIYLAKLYKEVKSRPEYIEKN